MGTKLKLDGSINWQDSALISEDTFCELLNTVFEYQLVNANSIKLNAKGYDLVDKQNGLCFQVTKDASRSKIQETLDKVAETGGRWHVRFLLLVEKHPRYRTSFDIPAAVEFDESNDLIDLEQLLKIICFAPIATLEEAERILRTNIEYYPELQRVPSTLAAVVKALSAVKLKDLPLDQRARFCIAEKIRANSLERGAGKIMRLAPYIGYVDENYRALSAESSNKALVVLESIADEYDALSSTCDNFDDRFFNVIDGLMKRIENADEVAECSIEERRFALSLLVVDAFARCKIFEAPGVSGMDK